LAWLADNHVCHRDIKPENIMLDSERVPKIVDFGSCCPTYRGGTKQPFTVKDQRRNSEYI
jgi:serine/threonine protein kinase